MTRVSALFLQDGSKSPYCLREDTMDDHTAPGCSIITALSGGGLFQESNATADLGNDLQGPLGSLEQETVKSRK